MTESESLHILVIEDDADTQANLRDILEIDNHRIDSAGSAAEAMDRDDWATISAIILDRKLPDVAADELLPRLKREAPDAAIIVVTGYADLKGAIAALRQGAADYIQKPIDPDELRARLAMVAKHRRLQDALRASEERFRRLFESGIVGIGVSDPSGRWLEANDELLRILGRSREELIAGDARWDDVIAAALIPRGGRKIAPGAQVMSWGPHEKESIRPDGTSVPVLMGYASLGTPADPYIFVVLDITAAKRAEDLLRRERDFAHSLIEAAPAVVLVLDAEGRVARFNRYAEELSGYRAHEVLGRDFFTTFLPEHDRPRIREVFDKTLAGIDTSGTVNPILTRNGRQREIRWSNRHLRDTQGHTLGIMAVGQDITDFKEAQERVLRAERLAAIGQMVTGLTHESRNALQRSQACLELLALMVEDRPDALNLIVRLQTAQDHLHQLYEDVRNYAAPIRLERRECNLAAIWREAWSDLARQRRDRTAQLVEADDCQDVRCSVDAFRLERVFCNIMENALAACPDPVTVEIACDAVEISGRPWVRVAIRDQGPGLGASDPTKIFEPFYTTKTQGTGLGMAIARRIVEAHGGQIDAGDAADGGAEIIITLPREDP